MQARLRLLKLDESRVRVEVVGLLNLGTEGSKEVARLLVVARLWRAGVEGASAESKIFHHPGRSIIFELVEPGEPVVFVLAQKGQGQAHVAVEVYSLNRSRRRRLLGQAVVGVADGWDVQVGDHQVQLFPEVEQEGEEGRELARRSDSQAKIFLSRYA